MLDIISITSLPLTLDRVLFVLFFVFFVCVVVVFVLLSTVFVGYKSVSQFYFGVSGFLFVKQMKREPSANTPKNVKRIAPSSGKSKNS